MVCGASVEKIFAFYIMNESLISMCQYQMLGCSFQPSHPFFPHPLLPPPLPCTPLKPPYSHTHSQCYELHVSTIVRMPRMLHVSLFHYDSECNLIFMIINSQVHKAGNTWFV